ncbi:DUF3579 domain-containing protein [Cupriavidus necator H16]
MPLPAAGIKSAPARHRRPAFRLEPARTKRAPAASNGRPSSGFTVESSASPAVSSLMNPNVREFFIQGITKEGKTFRPSDWAERLCGVMAQFRPEGDSGDPRLTYSPYVRPIFAGNVKCVVVDVRLRDIEPKALDFVLNFARDNNLQLVEACSLE